MVSRSLRCTLQPIPGLGQGFGLLSKQNRKPGVSDFQEKIKHQLREAAAGSELSPLEAMQNALEETIRNPEGVRSKQMAETRAVYGQTLVTWSLFSHEEIQREILNARNLLTQDSGLLTESMMEQRDVIIAEMESDNMLPPALLAQMKADPAFFEAAMRKGLEIQQEEIRRKQRQTGVAPEREINEAQKLVDLSLNDPEAARAKMIEKVHTAFGEILENVSNVTPKEMQKSLSDDIAIMKGEFDSIIAPLLEQRWAIIAEWQALGKYPEAEISRMKADPASFELRLRLNLEDVRNQLMGIQKAPDDVATLSATDEL